jgi:hypothetical protein
MQLPYFIRGHPKLTHLGRLNGRIPPGDLCGVDVFIYVPLDHQVSRLYVDGAKVASLFCGGWPKRTEQTKGLRAMLT